MFEFEAYEFLVDCYVNLLAKKTYPELISISNFKDERSRYLIEMFNIDILSLVPSAVLFSEYSAEFRDAFFLNIKETPLNVFDRFIDSLVCSAIINFELTKRQGFWVPTKYIFHDVHKKYDFEDIMPKLVTRTKTISEYESLGNQLFNMQYYIEEKRPMYLERLIDIK